MEKEFHENIQCISDYLGVRPALLKLETTNSSDGYANLPPQQRCRKIESKLKEMEAQLATHEQSRAGMDKMFIVYRDNPKLGMLTMWNYK